MRTHIKTHKNKTEPAYQVSAYNGPQKNTIILTLATACTEGTTKAYPVNIRTVKFNKVDGRKAWTKAVKWVNTQA